jgi:drug/metabolite transporter (DMT)-like permease
MDYHGILSPVSTGMNEANERTERAGAAAVAAAALLWGLWPLWVRGEAGGAATATVAMVVAGLAGLPLALREAATGRGRVAPRRARDWGLVGLLGACNALNTWLYFRGLDEGAVAPTVLTHYLAPVLVALAAPWILGERGSRRTPFALLLALGGTALLLGGPAGAGVDPGAARHGAILGGASAVFYAACVLLARSLAPRFGNAELFSFHALVAAAVLAPLAGWPPELAAWARPAAGAMASGLLAGIVYYAGLRRIPAERTGVLTYLEVPAAVAVGWLAFGERPGIAAAAGGALVVAAGVLVVTGRARRSPAPGAPGGSPRR